MSIARALTRLADRVRDHVDDRGDVPGWVMITFVTVR